MTVHFVNYRSDYVVLSWIIDGVADLLVSSYYANVYPHAIQQLVPNKFVDLLAPTK